MGLAVPATVILLELGLQGKLCSLQILSPEVITFFSSLVTKIRGFFLSDLVLLFWILLRLLSFSLAPVVYAYNPSYLGG
jgi:hypothetical protein